MNVAVLGLGFMGSTHLKAWKSVPGVRIAAVMSSDEKKLSGDLTSIEGNLGGPGERFDFSEVRKCRSLEEVLTLDIDAVDICLPTHRHAGVAMEALGAGRHVLLEKPMALSFEAAEEIHYAAGENDRILMVAQVLRFVPAYRAAADWMQGAGSIYSAAFRRRCAAPAWSGWLADKSRSGGGVFDLLIHDADFCISLWGMPDAVRATGYEDPAAGVDVIHAELSYARRPPVVISGGWHHPKSYPFSMDFTLVSEAGTLEWSSSDSNGPRAYLNSGETSQLPIGDTDPFVAELSYFAECVREKRQPDKCPPEQSAQAVAVMLSMLESRERNGEIVRTV